MASPPAVVAVARSVAVVAVVVEVVALAVVAVMGLVAVTVAVVQVSAVVAELLQSCRRPEGWFVGEAGSKLSRCRYSISEEIDRRRRLSTVSDWANRTRCRVL